MSHKSVYRFFLLENVEVALQYVYHDYGKQSIGAIVLAATIALAANMLLLNAVVVIAVGRTETLRVMMSLMYLAFVRKNLEL